MISLWILAILVVFAVGLSQQVSINMRAARFQKDMLETELLAKAGLYKAIAELKKDQNAYDHLQETWSTGQDTTGKKILEKIELEKDSGKTFSVKYLYDKEKETYYCIADEERRININGISTFDKNKIIALLTLRGIDEAENLADLIISWINPADTMDISKRENFNHPEELLAVFEYFYKEKSAETYKQAAYDSFSKIEDIITVNSTGQININTCSSQALKTIARACATTNSILSLTEAELDSLIGRIIQLRQESFFENIDPEYIKAKLESQGAPLSSSQLDTLTQLCNGFIAIKSNNFRIETIGETRKASTKIIAIYNRPDEKLVYWRQN